MDAVILAGGLGTRLRPLTRDLPKPMVPVADRPFLEYVLDYLAASAVKRVILSVGYRGEMIEAYFAHDWRGMDLVYAHEDKPLGTGGAVRHCLEYLGERTFFVLNGDTFFRVPLADMWRFHHNRNAELSMALKPMKNFERYGNVQTVDERVTAFEEKRPLAEGQINGGIYILDASLFERFSFPEKFSLETDLFEKHLKEIRAFGYSSDAYFIDIGIPEDFARAQTELPQELSNK